MSMSEGGGECDDDDDDSEKDACTRDNSDDACHRRRGTVGCTVKMTPTCTRADRLATEKARGGGVNGELMRGRDSSANHEPSSSAATDVHLRHQEQEQDREVEKQGEPPVDRNT